MQEEIELFEPDDYLTKTNNKPSHGQDQLMTISLPLTRKNATCLIN